MGKALPSFGDEVGPSLLCQFWVNHIPILGFQPQRLSNLFGRKDHYNFTQVGHYPMIKYRLQSTLRHWPSWSSDYSCNLSHIGEKCTAVEILIWKLPLQEVEVFFPPKDKTCNYRKKLLFDSSHRGVQKGSDRRWRLKPVWGVGAHNGTEKENTSLLADYLVWIFFRSYPGRVRKSFHLRDTRLETPTPRNSLSLQENYHFPFPRDYLKTKHYVAYAAYLLTAPGLLEDSSFLSPPSPESRSHDEPEHEAHSQSPVSQRRLERLTYHQQINCKLILRLRNGKGGF
ncbi:hypothetical protein SASPL_155520 (mitochondrion) [Salvia splendens]|uniref:Uncharacterized protein n=1 Tax=Salvia splendens TaxID=180675 RepID=A0A8X8VYE2_SALSN|nr:hypothetical protein SASPL_156327 [Salvia splendens]KAG6384667.1 hypothetical protein SASPL_155520 [Salvia splendens]